MGAESVLATIVAIGDLIVGLITELRHDAVVEESTVVRKELTFRAVGETLRRIFEGEVEIHRCARRERRFQTIDDVAEVLVVADRVVWCEVERLHGETVGKVHVQFADWRIVFVDQPAVSQRVVAADFQPALVRIDVHIRFHCGDARLW